mmetsp:Transcript_26407/g.53521  ORF Transcript_26407/g.53521 Transcript_26407/m.53521 type:complete len:407 (-) Transcript_26407:84-1304(-)
MVVGKSKKRSREASAGKGAAEPAEDDGPGGEQGGAAGKGRKEARDAGGRNGRGKGKKGDEAGGGKGARDGGKSKGKGKGSGGKPSSSRPSALRMLKPSTGRSRTVSVALPASIIENCQSGELKAMLVGQIARAATVFSVDEIVLYEDRSDAPQSNDSEGLSRGLAFFVRNLQYLETPQYLRRELLPMHRDLKWVGLLSPLDAPHHLRKYEKLAYREGAVLPADKAPKQPPRNAEGPGCWVNCGIGEAVWVSGQEIPSGVRVTVKLDENKDEAAPSGVAVAPTEPRTKLGFYWGYQVRIAKSLQAVFEECPFEGGSYDLTIGTSERGESMGLHGLPKFKHLLLAFGGLGGLEEAIDDELSGYPASTNPSTLFTRYVNICPTQTSRTIRTEEALLIALTSLRHQLPSA